jgi:hypothetical protein
MEAHRMSDPWLWGDGSDLLWGDGESMGDLSLLSTGTTWNPADAEAGGVTFSNGDLTAARSGAVGGTYSSGRATTSRSSGKRYFEITADNIVSAVDFALGVATSGANVATYLGQAATSWGYYSDGTVYTNDAALTTLSGYPEAGVAGCAIDLDAGQGWFCDETGSYGAGNPAAGTGAHFTFTPSTALFAAYTLFQSGGVNLDQITANFGATAFTHTVPSGFLGWDEEDAVAEAPAPQTLTYGAGRLSRKHVQTKYEIIEAIDRRIAAAEEAEREKVRKQEEAKRQLAELEEKKRQTKTIAERRRKLEARIAAYQSEITDLRETMIALMEEIERARVAFELQQTIADRRRRMLLMIAAAS